jgi:hypothetical protein
MFALKGRTVIVSGNETSVCSSTCTSGFLSTDRIEELAIDEHLRPDAVVDDVSAVLKKLAVDVLRDGSDGVRGVDGGVHNASLRRSSAGQRKQRQETHCRMQGKPFHDRDLRRSLIEALS